MQVQLAGEGGESFLEGVHDLGLDAAHQQAIAGEEQADSQGGVGQTVEDVDGFVERGRLAADGEQAADVDAHDFNLGDQVTQVEVAEVFDFGRAEVTGVEAMFDRVGVVGLAAALARGRHNSLTADCG